MSVPLPKPRHTIEKSNEIIRVTLPSKKNLFSILFLCFWFLLWGYMVYAFLYIAITINKVFEIGKTSNPPLQPGNVLLFVSLFFLLLFLLILAFGVFAIYRFLWILAGKEVIEANAKVLRVSRQLLSRGRGKEYSAPEVKDLRLAMQPPLFPSRRIQRLLRPKGMIAFDYGAKTFRFGQEIEEAEAKQIIVALQEGLAQQNAG